MSGPTPRREPRTEGGRRAVQAIKGGALMLWADDPDDPIAAMVAAIESEARATVLAELAEAVGGHLRRLDETDTLGTGGRDWNYRRMGETAAFRAVLHLIEQAQKGAEE